MITALIACLVLGACSSGMPAPGMLQNALLSSSDKDQVRTDNAATLERSDASRVLTAVAVEHITGKPAATFTLHK